MLEYSFYVQDIKINFLIYIITRIYGSNFDNFIDQKTKNKIIKLTQYNNKNLI